ncbi:MAG: glucarate dehydratase [Chloroflexi bacterium]|nr:glucarate dehydratase [Chloroflexota bacterium]
MRVTSVQADLINLPHRQAMASASNRSFGLTKVIVQVHTDEGITGLGEAPGNEEIRAAVLRVGNGFLKGRDPFDIERTVEMMPGPHKGLYGPNTTVQSAIDMALWDIMGKSTGRSLCELLGGRYRERILISAPIFDTSGSSDPVASQIEAAQKAAAEFGFKTFKPKAGVGKPGCEIAVVAALRKTFGDDINIRVDPNGIWSVDESMRIARRMEEYDLEWLEDPVWGIEASARLRSSIHTPIATNMFVRNFDQLPVAVRLNAVDVVLGDPRIWGSILTTKKLAHALEAMALGFAMHSSGEMGIAMAAKLHIAASSPNLSYAIDATCWYHSGEIVAGWVPAVVDGSIAVPRGPGLGVELDPDAFKLYKTLHDKEGDYHAEHTYPLRPHWWY